MKSGRFSQVGAGIDCDSKPLQSKTTKTAALNNDCAEKIRFGVFQLVSGGQIDVLSQAMTSKRTRRYLYAFMITQPLVLLLLGLDQGLGIVDIPRPIIHLSLALPWGAGVLATIYTLRELGLSVGHEWGHWALAGALVYGVQFYAAQEIYLGFIVPINLIVFPVLTLLLSHFDFRDSL